MSKIPFVKLTTYDDKSYYLTLKQAEKLEESLQDPELGNNFVRVANDKIRFSSIKSLEQVHLQLNDIPKYLVERIQKDYPKTLTEKNEAKKDENAEYAWRCYWADDPKCDPYRGLPITRKQINPNEPEASANYEPSSVLIDKQHLPYVCRKHEISQKRVVDPTNGKEVIATEWGRIVEELHIHFDYKFGTHYKTVKSHQVYT